MPPDRNLAPDRLSAGDDILAADIGATNSRLRLSRVIRRVDGKTALETVAEKRLPSGAADDLKANLRHFADNQLPCSGGKLKGIAVGLPGRVTPDRQACAISYLDPDVDVPFGDLFRELKAPGVLLNDLECGVLGILETPAEDLVPLCGTEDRPGDGRERLLLGMPGTGFGVGLLAAADLSLPSEGGHGAAALDPGDAVERRAAELARAEENGYDDPHVRVTWEDMVRGRAVARIYRAVVEQRAESPEELLEEFDALDLKQRPEAVSRWALGDAGEMTLHARAAFRVYGDLLGRAMQAMALLILPQGVYLGGEIVLDNRRWIAESFARSFRRHPVHDGYLTDLPVRIIDNPHLNLDGATHRAVGLAAG